MEKEETKSIILAMISLTIVIGFNFLIYSDWENLFYSAVFSIILIIFAVFSKKLMAYSLDAGVEHEIWKWARFGFIPHQRLKKPINAGIIFPLFFTIASLGLFKIMTFLTYETRALKARASKRFGEYSFSEMTDWHNALIGGAGIVGVLLLSVITYILPGNFEYFAKIATYYAFFNILPISKLDGTQILFGSRVLYAALLTITFIFTLGALILV